MGPSDYELLRDFSQVPAPERFEPILDRYLAFVYRVACRQSVFAEDAAEVTKAVFLALSRRSRRFSRRAVLAEWLFSATSLTARRLAKERRSDPKQALPGAAAVVGEGDTWSRVSPVLDPSLGHLKAKYLRAVLLRYLLKWPASDAGPVLRVKPARSEKRAAAGLRGLLRRLRKRKLLIETDAFLAALAEHQRAVVPPEWLGAEIMAAAPACVRRRPAFALARSTLWAMAAAKWRRRVRLALTTFGAFLLFVATLAGCLAALWYSGHLLPMLIMFGASRQIKDHPELAEPAKPWPSDSKTPLPSVVGVTSAAELYRTTNIWLAHLSFTKEHWDGLEPKRVPHVRQLMQKDGTIILRNPKARRSGLAGAIGFEYEWTRATLEFSGVILSNVACRYRGNGTYLNSLYGPKRPFKVDLDKFEKGQELAGVRTLNLANLIVDSTLMSDAMGYELFRQAGLPAPRTAYVWLTLTAEGKFERKPIGLYLLLQDLDARFAADQLGSKKSAIFKPVTYDLFDDLGSDWKAYESIYDPKTKVTPEQQQRVIDFARVLTHADDAEFARRVSEFVDLDEFAGFLGGLVMLSSYDGFLSNGQNYYMYLDGRSNKFGFIPWDLDNGWGSFPFVGTTETREQASIWHPWTSRNRLLERIMKVEEFRAVYRARLEKYLAELFIPERLLRRVDEMADVVRGPTAAESSFRSQRLAQSVSTNWVESPRAQQDGPTRPIHQIKRFIVHRAQSVRDQLDGKSKGVVLGGFNTQ